jgi:hypothetical protein
MLKHSQNEVRESLLELTRIYKPKNARKFTRDYIRKYRVMAGYEEELTDLVEHEMTRLKASTG